MVGSFYRDGIMTKKKKPKTKSKYWICDVCALEQGLIFPKWPVTCTTGICGHCEDSTRTTLTPIVDFEDPKTGRKPIFD